MIRNTQTADGTPIQIVSCDGARCPVKFHAIGLAAVARIERKLHPDGNGRHHCDGCRAMHRAAGAPQFPHPEHR